MAESHPAPDPAANNDELQREILYALTEPDGQRCLWTIEELAREMEDPYVSDRVNELHRAGLIHRTTDGYILATRAAARYIELTGRVA